MTLPTIFSNIWRSFQTVWVCFFYISKILYIYNSVFWDAVIIVTYRGWASHVSNYFCCCVFDRNDCYNDAERDLLSPAHWRQCRIRHGRLRWKSEKSTVSLWPRTHWHSTLGRHKSPTFDKVDLVGDSVVHDKLSNSILSHVCTDGRQSRNFMNINEDRLVKVTVACAASNRAPNMSDCVGDVSL